MRKPRIIFLSLLLAAIVGLAISPAVQMPVARDTRIAAPEVWAHRGSGGRGLVENTPEAVRSAIEEGFPGVELDTFYLADQDKIIIGHDRPADLAASWGIELAEFDFTDDLLLWLDLKNLDELSDADVATFAKRLRTLGLARRAYIENTSLLDLRKIKRHGLRATLWLTPTHIAVLPAVKYLALLAGIDAVSSRDQHFDRVQNHFTDGSVFVFTVNDERRVRQLAKNKAVAVILTDRPYGELSPLFQK